MSSVPLAFAVNKPTSWIGYSLDGQAKATITGNTTITGLLNGLHNLTVYANDTLGNTGASETVYFSITVPFPASWIVAAVVIIALVGVALLIYFKKCNR
jgi:hypothetical protein